MISTLIRHPILKFSAAATLAFGAVSSVASDISSVPAAGAGATAKTIVVLGDSLAAGYGLDPEEAFPALINEKVQQAGLDYTVVNAGVSGDTTAGGLRRIGWLLRQPVEILVLELGGNDGLRGLPVDSIQRNGQGL